MENVPLWLQVVTAVFASTVLGAIVTGFFNKRKLGADAAKLITDAAASVTQTMRQRLEELEAKDHQRDLEETELRASLRAHERWDRDVLAAIRKVDPHTQVGEPPALPFGR